MLETPSNRDRKLQSIIELNNNTTKDKTVKILLIIDIPPRILANVMCPHLYKLAYTIDKKLMALQQELIQKANSKEDYDEIADEIFRFRELRQKTTVDTAARDEQIKRINDLQDYISQQTALLTEFDESLVRRWIKQITIWDDRIIVELKSGVSIDVDA